LALKAARPPFTRSATEAPRQQITDRLKIGFLYLANSEFSDEGHIYEAKIEDRRELGAILYLHTMIFCQNLREKVE
jgi:hypothetical protein